MTQTTMIIDIATDEWVAACTASAARGCDVVDWLTAVDTAESLFVVVYLVDPGSSRSEMLRCELSGERPEIESITSWFPGADWHERETHEMFGIEFLGRSQTNALLIRAGDGSSPLRKTAPLDARVRTPWPGQESATGRRRQKLSPGVRAEWIRDE
ncbi:MAG: NADH-quinone oxidoreductase subunit C [Candidatus Nanopelagicales bacterium]|nr:NADH-quinone oxidoreductase subunit C [Candidatus Nanopelagicales bacterium]